MTDVAFCQTVRQSPPWTLAIAFATAPAAIATWYWRTTGRKQELDNAQQRLYSERFTSCVELLSKTELHSQMGAVFSLRELANDAPAMAQQISDVLCGFINDEAKNTRRENSEICLSPADEQALKPAPLPLIAACRSLGFSCFGHCELASLDLSKLIFEKENLKGANLRGANLRGVDLRGANLKGANLQRVDFEDANLEGAHLEEANLEHANLEGAELWGAHVDKETNLTGVDRSRADFQNVNGIEKLT